MHWIAVNKSWLFDGVAVTVPIALIGWWIGRRVRAESKKTHRQIQKAGNRSVNIQAGNDVTIRDRKDGGEDK